MQQQQHQLLDPLGCANTRTAEGGQRHHHATVSSKLGGDAAGAGPSDVEEHEAQVQEEDDPRCKDVDVHGHGTAWVLQHHDTRNSRLSLAQTITECHSVRVCARWTAKIGRAHV